MTVHTTNRDDLYVRHKGGRIPPTFRFWTFQRMSKELSMAFRDAPAILNCRRKIVLYGGLYILEGEGGSSRSHLS